MPPEQQSSATNSPLDNFASRESIGETNHPVVFTEPALHATSEATRSLPDDGSSQGAVGADAERLAVVLVGAGLMLAAVFQVSYVLTYYRALPAQWPYLLALNAFNLYVLLVVGALIWTPGFRRHWRIGFWSASVALIAGTGAISLATNSADELGFLVLGLVSAAGFLVPWSNWWHLSLSLVGIGAMLAAEVWCPFSQVPLAVRWLMLLASIGVGQFVISQRKNQRQKLDNQLKRLLAVERELRAQIAEREAAQRRVKERETLLEEIFEASPDVITVMNLEDGKFSYMNRALGLSGYSKEELIGKTIDELGIWADATKLEELFAQLRSAKTVRNIEFMLRRRDGALLPCMASATVANLGGQPSIVAVVRDITALKRAQEANAFWTAVFSSSDVAITTTTTDFIYNGWNPAAERLYGYRAQEALGKSLTLILASARGALTDDMIGALRGGQVVRELEWECRRKDGKLIVCSFTISPVYSAAGDLIGYSALSYDITARRQAEQRLAQRETKFREIFNLNPDPVSVSLAADGRFLDMNDRWLHLFGFSREEVLNRRPIDLGIWVDVNDLRTVHRSLQRWGRVINYEAMFRIKGGRQFVGLVSAVVTEMDGADVILCFVRDISERKKAERQLAESEAKLRQLFETTPDAIVVASLRNERILEVNPAFVSLSGYTREEALGSSPLDLNLWVDLGQRRAFYAELESKGMVTNMEATFRTRDGRLIQALFSAVKGTLEGEPCVFAISRDVTELKRAEAELRASEEKFRQVFDSALDAIVVADLKDGTIIDVNAEFTRRAGVSREDAIGKTTGELGMWARESDYQAFRESLRSYGCVRGLEALFRNKDGAYEMRSLNSSKVLIGDRKCVVTVSRDISALKEIERQLIESREAALAASKAKSEFLSSMSHEIRTPMNAIVGAADILRDTPLNTEQRRYLEVMQSNAQVLLGLINNILDLARIESGHARVERSDFELDRIVEETAHDMALRAHQKGLELAVRILPGVPIMLSGNSMHLRQCLVNLVGNAIKFTTRGEIVLTVELAQGRPNGAVGKRLGATANGLSHAQRASADARTTALRIPSFQTVANLATPANSAAPVQGKLPANPTAKTEGEPVWLHFTVSDTGIGIPSDKLETIFMDFTQVDSSTTRESGGSGLGLAIVRRLAELNGGQVWVESQLGQGSTFHLVLAFQARTGASVERPSESIDFAGARVLIADDTETNRLLAKESLSPLGAQVEQARSGREALAMVKRAACQGAPFEVVLLDARMPDINGFEVAQALQSQTEQENGHKPCVVLLLSSDDLSAQLARASEAGVIYYLVKPLKRAELRAMVATALKLTPQTSTRAIPSPPSVPTLSPAQQTPLRILLAEDSIDNRLVIKAFLANTPYKLDTAENGEQALEKFIANASAGSRYDLILMDIQMPVMDGYAATRMIRQWELDHELRPTPIVALTASAFAQDVVRSLEAGCDLHVSKPVRKAALLKAIEEVCVKGAKVAGEDGKRDPAILVSSDCAPAIDVRVAPELASLAPAFLERKREDLACMLGALEREDYETVRSLAHMMRGEGGTLGFDRISEIGASLENAAEAGDRSALRRWTAALSDYLARVRIASAQAE